MSTYAILPVKRFERAKQRLGGSLSDGSRWAPNIEPLARDFHVFALDQIGFGQSDKPLANYHTGMLAEFLVDFLKAANAGRARTCRTCRR